MIMEQPYYRFELNVWIKWKLSTNWKRGMTIPGGSSFVGARTSVQLGTAERPLKHWRHLGHGRRDGRGHPGQGPLSLDLRHGLVNERQRGGHVEAGVGQEGLAERRPDRSVQEVGDFSFSLPLQTDKFQSKRPKITKTWKRPSSRHILRNISLTKIKWKSSKFTFLGRNWHFFLESLPLHNSRTTARHGDHASACCSFNGSSSWSVAARNRFR